MSEAVKVQAVVFITKYEITEDMEDYYPEVKSMMDRLVKTKDSTLKLAVKQVQKMLKVDENQRNKLQNKALFDWYVSFDEISKILMEEIKDVKDGEVLILGAPNVKMAKALEEEDEIKEVVSFGSTQSFITEELENPKQLFDLTITGFSKLTSSDQHELGMLKVIYDKVVAALKPTGKLVIVSNSETADEEIMYL